MGAAIFFIVVTLLIRATWLYPYKVLVIAVVSVIGTFLFRGFRNLWDDAR